ncbi:carbohydrate ABC transporter permease [Microbacterium pseudoresistens]|uniref:Multiple sugar transport system permease protein n=1 Tax=Microbacterium pseudoresistens TaxID=640634 RepID=A0A7Y9ET29_9MICO|nr:carbohydrate ABC transporter permease [Microbacterium pseudoresistens]NYD53447.1 multiple sugar transport system permease protein [Microbacterium pseudoresistens]
MSTLTSAVPGTASPVSPAGRPRRRSGSGRRWLFTLAVGAIALLVNIPLFNAILVSFKPNGEIAQNPLGLPASPTLDHYANVLYGSGYDFPRFFLNSTLIALGTVLLVLVIAIPATYAIIRLGFGGSFILNAASGLRLLPAIFFIVPFFLLFSLLGLQDTIQGLIAANAFLNLPLAVILLASGLRDIPLEIEEAASVDGAGVLRTLLSVVTPMLAPTIVATAVLVFIFSWNDYLFALVLSTTDATPVTLGAANFVTSTGIRWGDISAASFLSTLPPLVFAVFAQKYLVSGLSAGAVKG